MPRKRPAAIWLLAAGLGAAWAGLVRADRRALALDPQRELLDAELGGRPFELASADGTLLRGREFGPERAPTAEPAPTVVLAHGWMASHRFWSAQIRALSRDHRVIAYDLRGHGLSERAVVAALSLGAMSLVALAGNDPATIRERVAAAALINTGVGDLVPEARVFGRGANRWTRVAALSRAAMTVRTPIPPGLGPITNRVVRHILDSTASPAVIAFYAQLAIECPGEVRGRCGAALSEADLYAALANLDVPTAVIAGERDRMTPARHSRRIVAALPKPDGPLITRPAGHLLPLTHPELVTGRIRALVVDHLGAPAAAPPTAG